MTETIKRAGDCKGTPAWQLDLMISDENARIWERLNAEPDFTAQETITLCEQAYNAMITARDQLAAASLHNIPEGLADRILGFECQVDDLGEKLRRNIREWRKGVRK